MFFFKGERGAQGDSGFITLWLEKGQKGEQGLPGEAGFPGETGELINVCVHPPCLIFKNVYNFLSQCRN